MPMLYSSFSYSARLFSHLAT